MANREQPHQDPVRVTLVKNVSGEVAPAYCLFEIVGYDEDTGAFRVTKPTKSGMNGLIVNCGVPIEPADADGAGGEGQASLDLFTTACWQDDGSSEGYPLAGQVWGSRAGYWFLVRRHAGFKVAAPYDDPTEGKVIVCAMDVNLVEYIRVIGCPSTTGLGQPADYSPGVLEVFDARADVFVNTGVFVWFRDENAYAIGAAGPDGGQCLVKSVLAGYNHGRPVYVGRATPNCRKDQCTTTSTTSTSTTTTTPGCYAASCKWDYTLASTSWALTESLCSTGCHCLAPTFCPDTDVCGYITACADRPANQSPPNCTGTTTTPSGLCTTTTTVNAGCGGPCEWYDHPILGWISVRGCTGGCHCAGGPGPALYDCGTFTSPCVYTPPPPPTPCGGTCPFVWVSGEPGVPDHWESVDNLGHCFGTDCITCACDPPTGTGSFCGQRGNTPCYCHGSPPVPPGCPDSPPPSPPPPPPPGCLANCVLKGDGSGGWVVVRGCPAGCVCGAPTRGSSGTCDTIETPCGTNTTSTTSTTTTTPGPDYYCVFVTSCSAPGGGGVNCLGGGGPCAPGPHCINNTDFPGSICGPVGSSCSYSCGGGNTNYFDILSGPYPGDNTCGGTTCSSATTTTPGPDYYCIWVTDSSGVGGCPPVGPYCLLGSYVCGPPGTTGCGLPCNPTDHSGSSVYAYYVVSGPHAGSGACHAECDSQTTTTPSCVTCSCIGNVTSNDLSAPGVYANVIDNIACRPDALFFPTCSSCPACTGGPITLYEATQRTLGTWVTVGDDCGPVTTTTSTTSTTSTSSTTSTTSTTTTTPSGTTTPGVSCTGNCSWICNDPGGCGDGFAPWTLTGSNCSTGCGCHDPGGFSTFGGTATIPCSAGNTTPSASTPGPPAPPVPVP